jgi:hypothetical protein
MTADELRALFTNPMGYVFQLAKAILTDDIETQTALFHQIEVGDQGHGVMLVAIAEFTNELREHRGDDALAWLDIRLRVLLDQGP